MHKKPLIIVLLLPLLTINSCRRNDNYGIPNVRVNETIFLSNPSNISLNAVGGWIYYPGGSRGLIIYRANNDEFNAYERHTPYQPENACDPVYVDSTDVIIQDPCSDSEWLIVDGSIISGPTSYPLLRYGTSFDGNAIHVYN